MDLPPVRRGTRGAGWRRDEQQRGIEKGRAEERRDVVAWLRGYGRFGNQQPGCIEAGEHIGAAKGSDHGE
jgi:hypothetical protein